MNRKVKIEVLKSSSGFKVLSLSGEPGDSLTEHKLSYDALLLMRRGNIIYKEEDRMEVLSSGESCDIPAGIIHKVTCTTKAKFFVVMPSMAKMRFEK